ncbi:hypothetical protein JQC91_17825 [Jannaschia sp. Os4]|uniref:hypothetical protein n=1 Tax=Jannaschia sp. Os4 TaxID=2807617 RepID=UPI001939A941|nr:hypothetical protein [Jannaschia sp. Os4]MBM2578170.1 hypothetical protein [Jannaschia sp. Os4]
MAVQLSLAGLDLPRVPVPVVAAQSLWNFPNVRGETICANAVLVGTAGEALVDSLLMRHGLLPMPVPGNLASDRLVYTPGGLARIQVKTCGTPRDGGYTFSIGKGYRNGPGGVRAYDVDAFDILALVCLADDAVLFTHEMRSDLRIPTRAIPGLRADPRASLEEALIGIGIDLTADASDVAAPRAA